MVEDVDQLHGIGGEVKGETGLECVLPRIVDQQIEFDSGREPGNDGIQRLAIGSTAETDKNLMIDGYATLLHKFNLHACL